VLGSAPFLALIVWLAYMAVETAVNHPQTIMFVGTHFS
jgi:hypothetical protein